MDVEWREKQGPGEEAGEDLRATGWGGLSELRGHHGGGIGLHRVKGTGSAQGVSWGSK